MKRCYYTSILSRAADRRGYLTSSFTHDDRAVTEPYTDLPALGLIAAGILLFGYLICSVYSAYEAKASYADRKEDLRTIAVALSADPGIACDGSATILDAKKLDSMPADNGVLRKYGRPGEAIAIEIAAGNLRWASGPAGRVAASYALPVTVRLNDARCLPGTMTVSISEEKR